MVEGGVDGGVAGGVTAGGVTAGGVTGGVTGGLTAGVEPDWPLVSDPWAWAEVSSAWVVLSSRSSCSALVLSEPELLVLPPQPAMQAAIQHVAPNNREFMNAVSQRPAGDASAA